MPLPESATTSTRCSGVGSSPVTRGCRIRIQPTPGPDSTNDPEANRNSIAVW